MHSCNILFTFINMFLAIPYHQDRNISGIIGRKALMNNVKQNSTGTLRFDTNSP